MKKLERKLNLKKTKHIKESTTDPECGLFHKGEKQKKFAETKGLQFPLIADTETTLLQELGCWGEKVTCKIIGKESRVSSNGPT